MGEEEDATLDWQVDHLVAKWFRPNFEAAQVSALLQIRWKTLSS